MGVMICNRNGCDSILCDRYSEIFGYICNECFAKMCRNHLHPIEFMASKKDDTEELSYDQIFPEVKNEILAD